MKITSDLSMEFRMAHFRGGYMERTKVTILFIGGTELTIFGYEFLIKKQYNSGSIAILWNIKNELQQMTLPMYLVKKITKAKEIELYESR